MFSEAANASALSNASGDDLLAARGHEDWSDLAHGRLSRGGHAVVSVFLGSIMVFGFLNNLVVLVLFCRFKALRTPVNVLLLNISVSDMLVCVCGTTLSFASSLRAHWLYGRRGCMWYGFVNSCFGIVSLVSLALLSYDRYSTLTVYNKRAMDYRKPLAAVAGAWLYSLLWTVPPLLGWSSYGLEGAGTSCSVTWTERTPRSHSYIVCLFLFCLAVPVLLMVYCYARLLYAVKQVGRIRRSAARRREFHILFMVLTTVVCYLLCWMPYGVVAMMATFGRPGLITPVASVVPSILAKSSTVINPLIYILMNKQFYRCFLVLFHCRPPGGAVEGAHSSMPSKTTVLRLNRRVYTSPMPIDTLQPSESTGNAAPLAGTMVASLTGKMAESPTGNTVAPFTGNNAVSLTGTMATPLTGTMAAPLTQTMVAPAGLGVGPAQKRPTTPHKVAVGGGWRMGGGSDGGAGRGLPRSAS